MNSNYSEIVIIPYLTSANIGKTEQFSTQLGNQLVNICSALFSFSYIHIRELQIRQATDGEEDRNHFWQLGKAM
jgi:hypothetical protein